MVRGNGSKRFPGHLHIPPDQRLQPGAKRLVDRVDIHRCGGVHLVGIVGSRQANRVGHGEDERILRPAHGIMEQAQGQAACGGFRRAIRVEAGGVGGVGGEEAEGEQGEAQGGGALVEGRSAMLSGF